MQSVVNYHNLPTTKIIDEFFLKESLNLLKQLRFGVGKVDMQKVKFVNRLDKYICGDFCLSQIQKDKLREDLLIETILYQKEL